MHVGLFDNHTYIHTYMTRIYVCICVCVHVCMKVGVMRAVIQEIEHMLPGVRADPEYCLLYTDSFASLHSGIPDHNP